MKRNLVFILLLAGFFASCTLNEQGMEVTSVQLSQTTAVLHVGEVLTLTTIVNPAEAKDKSLVWTSSDPSVATVSQTGQILALKPGTTTVTATSVNGISCSCKLIVASLPVEVTSVTVDPHALTLVEGETGALSVYVKPDNADDKNVAWSSSNPNVATVDANGVVTAVAAGQASITATAGNHSQSCIVTVKKGVINVEAVQISSPSLSVMVGETVPLTATVYPDNATDKSVKWTSSNTQVAEVDQDGRVTGKAIGTAIVIVTTNDGYFVARCEVTVFVPFVPVTGISLDKSEMELIKGSTVNLVATVMPENASQKTVGWSSSATNVATVDDSGKVTAVGSGTSIITASSGDYSATCKVTVSNPVESVALDKTSAVMMVGDELDLIATITPADADNPAVSWSCDNPSVVSVDNGKVKALKLGSATVTVVSEDGGKSASCRIDVVTIEDQIRTAFTGLSGSLSYVGSYWQISSGTQLKVSISNYSSKSITLINLNMHCGYYNVEWNIDTKNSVLEGGHRITATTKVPLTVYSPIATFTYEFEGQQYTSSAQFDGVVY